MGTIPYKNAVTLVLSVAAFFACARNSAGQSPSSPGQAANPVPPMTSVQALNAKSRASLDRRISLDLRDATLLEALFTVRDESGLNLVVGNEVEGTVNASFTDTTVHQILDSLLLPRGYGYRIVSGSISVVSLSNLGDTLPMFETEIVQLEFSSASELVSSVESMLSPEGRVHSVESSNSLIVMDYPMQLSNVRRQVGMLEAAAQRHRQRVTALAESPSQVTRGGAAGSRNAGAFSGNLAVRIFRPQFVTADVIAQGVTPLLSADGRLSAIEAEDKIVISDTSETLDRIALAIEQLDLPRPQVRIRALIYDVSLDDAKRIGVNLQTGLNGTNLNAAGDVTQSLILNSLTAAEPAAQTVNGVLTLTSLNRRMNLSTIIQALHEDDDSRLLADPNVVVMNHEAAEISIVTEIPYQQLTQGLEGGTIGTTEFREAGVRLNVTPHIAQDNTIAMLVNPSFSLLTGFSPGDNAPIIDRRETQTTVRVANGQTLILGGLKQRTRIVEHAQIPGLGKIPYVGHLFRHRANSVQESELMVFITPEIVYPDFGGTQREACIGRNSQNELAKTPTGPLPFGKCAVEAEERYRNRRLDHICRDRNCSFCRSGCGECLEKPIGCPSFEFGMVESDEPLVVPSPSVATPARRPARSSQASRAASSSPRTTDTASRSRSIRPAVRSASKPPVSRLPEPVKILDAAAPELPSPVRPINSDPSPSDWKSLGLIESPPPLSSRPRARIARRPGGVPAAKRIATNTTGASTLSSGRSAAPRKPASPQPAATASRRGTSNSPAGETGVLAPKVKVRVIKPASDRNSSASAKSTEDPVSFSPVLIR